MREGIWVEWENNWLAHYKRMRIADKIYMVYEYNERRYGVEWEKVFMSRMREGIWV